MATGIHVGKRMMIAEDAAGREGDGDRFDELPDELVVSILAGVAASAGTPADFVGATMAYKRFWQLGQDNVVLKKVSPPCLAVRASKWSEIADKFLQRCANAGNHDAAYILGMIRFYCLRSRRSGAALMVSAASGGHLEALYSLAVIQFNGSGGTREDRDLSMGAGLCARASRLGYGVRPSAVDGHLLILQATCRQRAETAAGNPVSGRTHAANKFLAEWFASQQVPQEAPDEAAHVHEHSEVGFIIRLCANDLCGRQQTRPHEFRRCSVCTMVNYCSRACECIHWRRGHKLSCTPLLQDVHAVDPNLNQDVAAAGAAGGYPAQ